MTHNQDLAQTLRLVADYLDSKNATVKLAYATGQAISDAADATDAEKLKLFDEGIARLHKLCCEWLADGFARFFEVAQRAGIEAPVGWVEQQVRDYLEPRLGHQLRYGTEVDCPTAAPYLWKGEFPHKAIVWWVAEAASQEGGYLVLPTESPFDERSDVEMLLDLDEQLMRSSYSAPCWLRRIRDFNRNRPGCRTEPLSLEETRQEIGFIQFELWTELDAAICKERLKAQLAIGLQQVPVAPTATRTADAEPENLFRKRGKGWEIRFRGTSTWVPHSAGIQYIAHLVKNPRRKISVGELTDVRYAKTRSADATIQNGRQQDGLREGAHPWNRDEITTRIGTGDPIAALDQKTIDQCKKRLKELEFELGTPVSEERREAILEEFDHIDGYLSN